MNVPKQPSGSTAPHKLEITREPISPNSKKVYVNGKLHPQIRVPFREITLSPTAIHEPQNGGPTEEHNEPVIVYDTSGPYTDPKVDIDIRKGVEPLRAEWILARGATR